MLFTATDEAGSTAAVSVELFGAVLFAADVIFNDIVTTGAMAAAVIAREADTVVVLTFTEIVEMAEVDTFIIKP